MLYADKKIEFLMQICVN